MENKEMENKEMETTQQPIDEIGGAVGRFISRFGKGIFTGLKNVFTKSDTKVLQYASEEIGKVVGGLAKSNSKQVSLTAIKTTAGYKRSLSVLVEDLAVKRYGKTYKELATAERQNIIKEATAKINTVVKTELQAAGKQMVGNIDNLKGAKLTKMGSKTAQITKTIAQLDKIKYNKASSLLKTNAKLVGEGKQGAALLSKVKGGKVNIVKGGELISAEAKTLGQTNIKVFRLSKGQWKTLALLGITGAAVLYIIGKLYPNDAVAVIDDNGNDGTQGGDGGNTGGGNTGGGNTGGNPVTYTTCTSFPMKYGCKSDQIREVQSCLGMEQKYQTGNFGPMTARTLFQYFKKTESFVGLLDSLSKSQSLTKEMYDAIIAKCKGTNVNPNITTTTGTTTGSTTTLTGTTTGSTLPPITPPAKPAEPVMDKNRLQELLSSNNLVVRRGGKVVVWKGPKLSGPDYYILSKSLEEKGYTEVRQRETGDRGDEDITMKYKWKKLD
jgi:hypothetical protein